MSTHNICFPGEIKKNINTFGLKKGSYQELYGCCPFFFIAFVFLFYPCYIVVPHWCLWYHFLPCVSYCVKKCPLEPRKQIPSLHINRNWFQAIFFLLITPIANPQTTNISHFLESVDWKLVHTMYILATVFDLITAHTPISAHSSNSIVFRLQSVYFLSIKAYVMGTHLNCIDLSMQFKWVPTTYVFIKKIWKKWHKHYQISPLLIFF